jgi:hypothetical protein
VTQYDGFMRTTLDIDEDVLQISKELATLRKTTAGKVLSDLARQALRPSAATRETRNGVPLLAARPGEQPVSMEVVNQLRDLE